MIELTLYTSSSRGGASPTIYLAPAAIAKVIEAGTSSQWHGIYAYVHTFDGAVHEVRETASHIVAQIQKAQA